MDRETFLRLQKEAEARSESALPAHDFSHVLRVVENARVLAREAGEDEDACALAALLHELFNYPKGHPESHKSGDVCAEHAEALLKREKVDPQLIRTVSDAIRDHAFSKGAIPETMVGKILQDADRLDAIGAIGIARCMATCSEMKRPFYSPNDPFCDSRPANDKEWGIDHFFTKLFRIPSTLHTDGAKKMAHTRIETMRVFLAALKDEIGAS